jgi:hypothetical protein
VERRNVRDSSARCSIRCMPVVSKAGNLITWTSSRGHYCPPSSVGPTLPYQTSRSPRHVQSFGSMLERGIFVRRRFPWGGSDSSRCRSRLRMPRFFAVAASVAICRLAQHERRLARGTHACGVIPTNRSRRLLTPCALRLGGPHLTSQPLTPSVAPWVLPRDLRSRVRRSGSRLSSGVDAPHVARTPDDATRLKATPPMSPGCLPSVRSRPCDRAKPSAFPVTFARKSSHPFRPMRVSASRRDPPPHRATPCNLGLPRGSPRWRGEDASLRPLQPTVDTSTRRPLDFRARSLRCADRRMLPFLPLAEKSGSSVRRQTALRQSDPGWARA